MRELAELENLAGGGIPGPTVFELAQTSSTSLPSQMDQQISFSSIWDGRIFLTKLIDNKAGEKKRSFVFYLFFFYILFFILYFLISKLRKLRAGGLRAQQINSRRGLEKAV